MKKVAAFFDIDGTIYREGLITEMFKKMVTHEIISPNRWRDEVMPAYMAWDRRVGDYDIYLDKMVEVFKEATLDVSLEHINFIAKKVIEQKGDRVYQYTRRCLEEHKKRGDLIIGVSGSPIELVKEMAEKYQFDDYRGTIYHTNEKGYYTGEVTPMWDSVSKANALKELSEKYDLDLSMCYSYGDTKGDLSMFQLTGHPTAINPTKELIHEMKANPEVASKVKVIVERKDVIYHMDIHHLMIED